MKFRILRDYDVFRPQVWCQAHNRWNNVIDHSYLTIEAAKKVCEYYKTMVDNPIVEEFEL